MFEICPNCGNHEWNKLISVDKWSVRCPKCGASWENRAFPLFILTGCSGIGKTTAARKLMELKQDFVVLDGDILFTADEGEYMNWVERIEGLTRDIMQCKKPVLWTMAGNLDKLKKAWNQRFFPEIYCLALVCAEEELRRRMTEGRGISDTGWISDSVKYNSYFLEHDRLGDIVFERLDITVLDPVQAAERVGRWMQSKLAVWGMPGGVAAGLAANMPGADPAGMAGAAPRTGSERRAAAFREPGNGAPVQAGRIFGAESGTARRTERRAAPGDGCDWYADKEDRAGTGREAGGFVETGMFHEAGKFVEGGQSRTTGKLYESGKIHETRKLQETGKIHESGILREAEKLHEAGKFHEAGMGFDCGTTADTDTGRWIGKQGAAGNTAPWLMEKVAEPKLDRNAGRVAETGIRRENGGMSGSPLEPCRMVGGRTGAVRAEQAFPEVMPPRESGAGSGAVRETGSAFVPVQDQRGSGAVWIWYYGDFELYHSLKLHARRDEFGHNFPPFWRLDDCRHNVRFRREVELKIPEKIIVYARGVGNVEIDGKRRAFGTPVYLAGGKHTIQISVLNAEGLPCVFVEGETVISDEGWLVNDYGREWVNAGSSAMYTGRLDDPQVFKFCYEKIAPTGKCKVGGGVLYDFGKETFAKLRIYMKSGELDIFYGETEEEALNAGHSYLRAHVRAQNAAGRVAAGIANGGAEGQPEEIPARAFRYLHIRAASGEDYRLEVYHEYLPLAARGSFRCSDELFSRIWETAAYTFRLNSREFFLDGIKRDRWVWSGDAYQSYLINRYLFFDRDICKRTILALRGNDPVEKHVNTIMDYSFFWLISIYDYYEMSGDTEFVRRIFPKMRSLMDFCLQRLDSDGFAVQMEDDWVFIDWADMDKTGAVCTEQMLLARSLEAAVECGRVIGEECTVWRDIFAGLRERIDRFFWDGEKGAFIDSFASGKRSVTRHANIFALLFGYADGAQRQSIIDNVLSNDAVAQIRTPYFKLYELEALCRAGQLETVTEKIRAYWGAMLGIGATSFWEEYTPQLPWNEQLGMYGDKYGKSLCHAWGASPVYLVGRYYMGVRPTSPGYRTFEVAPNPGGLGWFEGVVPVGEGNVSVRMRDGILEVCADVDGGVLVWNNGRYALGKGLVKRLSC